MNHEERKRERASAAPDCYAVSPESVGGILQAIYDSEINLSISWTWDCGIKVAVYNTDLAGTEWKYEWVVRDGGITSAVAWAVATILDHDANSGFARRWKAGELC